MTNHQAGTIAERQVAQQKLDTLVWGMLLVWIGLALLITLGWGIGLLGVGVISWASRQPGSTWDPDWIRSGWLSVLSL